MSDKKIQRTFHFSYDELVYASDLQRVIDAARAFPNAKLYICDKTWNEEDQHFFLADSPEHALQMHNELGAWIGSEELSAVTVDDFSHGDL